MPPKPHYPLALLLALSASSHAWAQSGKDSTSQLDAVVVTATRTERKLSNVAVPVTVISKKTIQQSGSLRLNNILQEQAGLYITNSFGNGVQIQGLSPDYVLILIDGEPLIGRNGGVLDLNRITVNNIRQIEVVKGPSSSLYGSEAMGGVINIITDQSKKNALNANFRYGSYRSSDANLSGTYNYKNFSLNAFVNRTSSNGYDFSKNDTGQTRNPWKDYTAQLKLQQQFSAAIRLGLNLRYYYSQQNDLYSTGKDIITGRPDIREYNINPYVNFALSGKLRTSFHGYFSQFQSTTRDYVLRNDSLYYDDFFQQRFQRIENQTDWKLASSNDLNIGGGYTWERLNTNRYSGIRTNTIGYLFLQDEQRFGDRLTLIGGVRYDNNAAYASRLSPKLALHWKASERLSLNASYGAGFKAPDYRQLYLNFTNNAAGGYTVYGANEIAVQQLQQQVQAGILANITPFGYQLKQLRPEYSTGFNLGAGYKFSRQFTARVNLFRNDIDNLIITKIIAYKPTNAPVYSYFNINSAFTEGAELELNYQLTSHLRLEAGYQYLLTADKEVLRQIREGKIFGKAPGSLIATEVKRSDYGGLPDRSRHMANVKLFYGNSRWFASLRALYRSRWGVSDKDGNLILNRDDEYAKGYLQLNISGGVTLYKRWQLRTGIDNLTNYRDQQYLADQTGITWYTSLSWQILNTNKQK